MAATKAEIQEAEYIKQRQARAARAQANFRQVQDNPLYAQDPFDPNAYLPTIPSDPALAEPLPQGRYIDPQIPSPLNAARMGQVREFRDNPRQYIQDNAMYLNNEQSLLDRGKSMLSRLFDYQDDADLQMFGVNLSAVETVWDKSIRHLVGSYDLLSIGLGGLISAAPGGVDTLSYDELSGGLDVGEVLSGEMEPNMAPSPGQIAIASVAKEAKRIRDGQARLSDVLLLNPATAPFIMAALAAETSPLQQEGFDLMDPEQREKAFSSGWEQWMSGVTDAGLMFADPLIGVGIGVKVARLGLLGVPGTQKYARAMQPAWRDAAEEILPGSTKELDDIVAFGMAQQPTPGSVLEEITKTGDVVPIPEVLRSPDLDYWAKPKPKFRNPLGEYIYRIAARNPDGTKKMSAEEIAQMREFKATTNPAAIADMLYKADNPALIGLVFESINGAPGALEKLNALKPAFGAQVFSIRREHYRFLALNEPAKAREAADTMSHSAETLRQQSELLQEQMRKLTDESGQRVKEGRFEEYTRLKTTNDTLRQSIREAEELYDVALGNRVIDPLDPTSAFFSEDYATRVIDDIMRSEDVVTSALRKDIYEASIQAKMALPVMANAYSRMVAGSRMRRSEAAYQYSVEGTSIFPRKRIVETDMGRPIVKSDGWLSSSEFPNVGRIRRNARVWRWAGTETPVGYIGLKGTSTVGSEREFTAALNLDMYSGQSVKVTRNVTDANGNYIIDPKTGQYKTEVLERGGLERRNELFQEFYASLNNPDMDSFKVLQNIEFEIMKDFSDVYAIPMAKLQPILDKANAERVMNLDLIRRKGYWIDPETKTQHHSPYLQSQLANGTYMQNFGEIERILKKELKKDGGSSFLQRLEIAPHLAGSAYNAFNNVWRPVTLMRLSYTQRNVFEGMLRAMAYNSSLLPLTWPIRATTNGVRNKIVQRTTGRKVAAAQKKIDSSEYGRYLREYKDASVDYWSYETAINAAFEGDAEKMFYVFTKSPGTEARAVRMDAKQYARELKDRERRVKTSKAALEANEAAFTESVKGTAFGTWRRKELDDLDADIAKAKAYIDQITDAIDAPDLNGKLVKLENNPGLLEQLASVTMAQRTLVARRETILYDSSASLIEFQSIAGRQRRLGSGTSIGPDGNKYNDAFNDAYEQINRGLMSSDNTVKQTLSLKATVWESLFRRQLIREHSPVEWIPGNKKAQAAWADAMVSTIETASSSPIVRQLVKNDWDVEKTLVWLTTTDEGKKYSRHLALASGGDGVYLGDALADVAKSFGDTSVGKERKRLKFVEEVDTPTGGSELVFNANDARAYIIDVSQKVQSQMMGHRVFYDLLERRIIQKSGMKQADLIAPPATSKNALRREDVDVAIASLTDEQKNGLGYLQGSEVIDMGIDSVVETWKKFTTGMFRLLGTIPEDSVVRGPFYNTRFKATRNALIENYWQNQGTTAKAVKRQQKKAKGSANQDQGMTIQHDEFKIPASELSRIEVAAHRRALADTREYIYTIERRTKLGKYGEWVSPFISAQQNAVVVGGKLLYKEPWLAPFLIDLWRTPTRLGVEDEQGNILMPMPFPWVRDLLQDNPNIPFLGGVIDSNDEIRIPKNGINVWMPESGFGIAPRPTPWVQVAASELMKAGAFPVETPQVLRSALGDKEGDEIYNLVKDYVFGEDQGISPEFLSFDKLMPAYTQRALQSGSIPIISKKELSTQYGYQFALQWHTQMARYMAGERDEKPTPDEINKRTTNMFWFNFLGNIGLPTPLTPYPILTRPIVDNPTTLLQEIYSKYKTQDPVNANLNMQNSFGDWALQQAMTKVTSNIGGADPTAETVSDIKTFDGLLRQVAPLVGEDLDVLGIVVNNRTSLTDYEQTAYQWQKANVIPGTNQEWREVQSPEFALAERQKVAGWTVYRQFMDQLDAQLQSSGLTSYESAGAASFKAARERFLENMANNPDYAGWLVDYQYRGGARAQAAVRVIEAATMDEQFVSEMVKSNKSALVGIMSEYVYYRRGIIEYLESTGKSIDHKDNIAIKISWANMRQAWKERDIRWADIANLYLSADDNPQFPGNFIGDVMPLPLGMSEESMFSG